MINLNESKQPGWGLILVYALACILLGLWIGLNDGKRSPKYQPSSIPPRPDMSQPMVFDFATEKWRYLYSVDPRPNEQIQPRVTEQDIQRYLEKTVPNYLRDTYWGQEYNTK